MSFSLPSSAASPLPSSPPRWREHASEAGSPTLEQVLLMSRHSPGTPSPADAGYGSLNHERTRSSSPQPTTSSSPSPTSLPSSMARLTMADVVGIDVAVAQAAQTLQQLQQQQAALYGGMGAMYMPQYYPHQNDQMGQPGGAMLGSILANGHQPHQQALRPGQQARDPLALERAARLYRSAASVCEVCFNGDLPIHTCGVIILKETLSRHPAPGPANCPPAPPLLDQTPPTPPRSSLEGCPGTSPSRLWSRFALLL